MKRLELAPRPGWQAKVADLGLVWHTPGGAPYWNEAACYQFDADQAEELEAATAEVYRLFLAAGDHVVRENLFHLFEIPPAFVPAVRAAWEREPPALNYGRFDFGYDGVSPPKLFEFNCDTPTSLLEAAVIQWDWKQAVRPEAGQFNSLHEQLVARWREVAPRLDGRLVHFAHAHDVGGEDAVTTAYLADTAREAGLDPLLIEMSDIGWDGGAFVDLDGRRLANAFKLYPWEWMVREGFGPMLATARTNWIEPIWKMIWSNKAILPILYRLFPGHPNLLRAQFEEPVGESYACKPILAREGANVTLVREGEPIARSAGAYGGAAVVYQELFELPCFGGRYPVIGSWSVDGIPAGVGVREDGLITGDTAQFVPHIVAAA